MTEITIRTDMDCDLVDYMGSDASIVAAARVSVVGDQGIPVNEIDPNEYTGLINYLMSNRHGTPFEHNAMTLRVSAPIFVFREFHRHRIGFSYNEQSARYSKLEPVFYVPAYERPIVNGGTSARPEMVPGTSEQHERCVRRMADAYVHAYKLYLEQLDDGIANELARTVLPVAIYSTMYTTLNMRSMMSFLGLRTKEPASMFPSRPQYEIEMVARMMESLFEQHFPLTYAAWNKDKRRVAP